MGAEQRPNAGWRLADHLGDMVSAHAPDGSYRYASAAAKTLFGYEPADLVGRDAYELFHPDDVEKVTVAHRSALDGAPITVTYRLRCNDGEFVWVETTSRVLSEPETGEVTEIVCCTRAVDERDTTELDVDRAAGMTRIEQLLSSDAVVPVFQPIFELEGNKPVALEALARFPGNPAHSPERWFADAWEVGLGIPLELHAARRAMAAMDRLGDGLTLFVNASPQVVAAPGFLQVLGDSIDRITVEVTEHLRIDDYGLLSLELARFREAGGQLAIDDFGSGFASFRHVLELRPQWIKLDRSLVHGLGSNPFSRGLAHAVSSFATESGVKVIAEGIETADQLRQVRELGIAYGQGFHLAPPAPLEQALGG